VSQYNLHCVIILFWSPQKNKGTGTSFCNLGLCSLLAFASLHKCCQSSATITSCWWHGVPDYYCQPQMRVTLAQFYGLLLYSVISHWVTGKCYRAWYVTAELLVTVVIKVHGVISLVASTGLLGLQSHHQRSQLHSQDLAPQNIWSQWTIRIMLYCHIWTRCRYSP